MNKQCLTCGRDAETYIARDGARRFCAHAACVGGQRALVKGEQGVVAIAGAHGDWLTFDEKKLREDLK
jgi:hypothetical protein